MHGHIGLVTLGAVFLAVTGGEALYADLGHFGRKPIQTAWLGLVLPALLINYFGQGALVLADPAAIENPFYRLVPDSAAAADDRAGDGRDRDRQPGGDHRRLFAGAAGDPARPAAAARHPCTPRRRMSARSTFRASTRALLIGVLLLVGLFRTSSALASAYGIAVTTTMVVDGMLGLHRDLETVAMAAVAGGAADGAARRRRRRRSSPPTCSSCSRAPGRRCCSASSMVLLILTWRRGTGILANKTRRTEVPLDTLLRSLEKKPPHVVPGTAVFLTSDPDFAPTALLHNLKHNKVLHEHNVILTIITADTPRVPRGGAGADHAGVAALQRGGAEVRLHGDSRTCRRRWRSRASTAGSSTSCRRRSSCRGARSSRRRIPACRAGRTGCSSGWRKLGERRHRLLPDPDRAGGRGRHAGDGVNAITLPRS